MHVDDSFTIGDLENFLLSRFPAKDAEPWDRTGLVVGDRNSEVSKVAIALDPTVQAIQQAAQAGANVLVTHHPPFLDAPDDFQPAESVALHSGAGVYAAISSNVALMCFHTALDASHEAHQMLPGILGFSQTGVLDPLPHDATKGYGQLCDLGAEQAISLQELADLCVEKFGRQPRVWGTPHKILHRIVTGTGAGGNLCAPALENGVDCLVVGELKYHAALDLSQAGVCIIELGHDVSEIPLTEPLAQAVGQANDGNVQIVRIEQCDNWFVPNSRI